MENPFEGKTKRIQERHNNFWRVPCAADDVLAYSRGDDAKHKYGEGLRPKERESWLRHDPIFRNPSDDKLAENDAAFIIGNITSFDTNQYPGQEQKAGMSMIHLLAIPRARIFNGVSLERNNFQIIDNMIELFKTNWQTSDTGKQEHGFKKKVIKHALDSISKRRADQLRDMRNEDPEWKTIENAHQMAMSRFHELEHVLYDLKADDFLFGLHLWDEQSISHMHLHIIARPPELRRYSTRENDEKTVDAQEVMKYYRDLFE